MQVFCLECRFMFFLLHIQNKFLVNTSARPSSLPWDGIFYCVCTWYSHKLIVYFCALCTLNKESQKINIIFEFFLALTYHVHTCINAQGIKSNVCLSLHDLPILNNLPLKNLQSFDCTPVQHNADIPFIYNTTVPSTFSPFVKYLCATCYLYIQSRKCNLLNSKTFIKTYKWYCI